MRAGRSLPAGPIWDLPTSRSEPRLEGVALRVRDRVDRQVDVEIGPVKMPWRRPLKPQNRLYRGSLEPGEVLERQEQLTAVEQQPEAVLGNVRDLNFRSGCARHLESPVRDPRPTVGRDSSPERSARSFAPALSPARSRT